jgi:hypothetical protein
LGRLRSTWLVTLAGVFILLHAAVAASADLRFIEVNRDDDLYTLRSVSWFSADPDSLYNVLTDYDQFLKFSSAIVESRNLSPDDKGRPDYTRMEGCLLFWCQSFVRIGHLNLKPAFEITAITDPERSNFKRARERWQLRAEDGGTLLIYEFEMIPDFWVPPVLGPFYIKRALKSGGANAVNRIEAIALGKEPLP